eukprot:g7014.t1
MTAVRLDGSDSSHQQRRRQVEERLWAVLKPFLSSARAEAAAQAGSCGLWKAPHVSQSCQWDCGVSCVQMVLRGLGREAERASLLASLGTRSVWTIDLAMLLHRQGVRFTYGTRTAGVTEAYSAIDFYRDNFDRDAPRVQALFKAAEEAKVGAVQKAFSWQELAVLVSSYNYAAIVLVDSRYLFPTSNRLSSGTPVLAPPSPAAAPSITSSPSTPSSNSNSSSSGSTKVHHGGESSGLPAVQSWSTPKRHREETEDGGWNDRFEGAWATGYKQACAEPSRRRRKRPTASGSTVVLMDRSSSNADLSKSNNDGPRVPVAAGIMPRSFSSHSALSATATMGEPLTTRDANVTKHLRVSPAPHARLEADDNSEMEVAVFATPPTRQSVRKSLARSPAGGALWAGGSPGSNAANPAPSSGDSTSCYSIPPRRPPVAAETVTSQAADSAYCGHYILLVGWSEADGVFIARDPALPSSSSSASSSSNAFSGGASRDPDAHVCIALTPEVLDRARRSYGTDEDVLVVDLARSRRGGVPTAPLAAAAAATALAASASSSSSAAASAVVGLLALAATAAAAGAEASGFKWPDRAAWFGGSPTGDDEGGSDSGSRGGNGAGGGGSVGDVAPRRSRGGTAHGGGGAESAVRRLASLLSLAASGLRFPAVVGDGSRPPRVSWGTSTGMDRRAGSEADEKEEHERWAFRMASAMLSEGGRRAAYTMEGLLQGGRRAAYTMEGLLQGGAHTMEGLLQGGAHTMEGLLQGGRRAAYTMEGLLEGGRRAAYNLRDQLAEAADAPGGAGAESCAVAVFNSPGSPVSTVRIGAAVVSPA